MQQPQDIFFKKKTKIIRHKVQIARRKLNYIEEQQEKIIKMK